MTFLKSDSLKRVTGFSLFLASLYLLLGFTSYLIAWFGHNANDLFGQTPFTNIVLDGTLRTDNWGGRLGAYLSHLFIKEWFGIASYLILLVLFNTGFRMLFGITLLKPGKTFRLSFIGLIFFSVAFGYIFYSNSFLGVLGGIFGHQSTTWLNGFIGRVGTAFLLLFVLFAVLVFSFRIRFKPWKKKTRPETLPEEEEEDNTTNGNKFKEDKYNTVEFSVTEDEDFPASNNHTEAPPPPEDPDPEAEEDIELTIEPTKEEKVTLSDHQTIDTLYDPTLDLSSYVYPTLDLLDAYQDDNVRVSKEELERNKNRIVETLQNYSIQIEKIKATIGPSVTLYEIIPAPGVRISKIKNLEDDIALSLSALGIRIIAPIPGKGTIGIEVPNQVKETVPMKSILGSERFQSSRYELPFGLGKTISNESFVADLAKMPHILMAGATGQGKSVGLNAIITSLLYKKHPSQLKFIMVDPKKVELTLFSKIERHFLAKLPDSEEAIITDTRKVVRTLNSLGIEMDNRYELLKDAQVRNIKEYNEKFVSRKLNPNEGHRYLPYLVVVVDEFADLIMTAGKEIENPLTRLAQLARAVGIHLIIATQRPSVNIITGTIKANFPARIAYRVISKIDSRTILDSGGAEQLIGRGDMLLATGSDIIRLQCAFVDTHEVERVTDFIGSQRGYPDAFHLPEFADEESEAVGEFDPNERDELFDDAARIIVQNQQGSTSLLQRRLKLGYNRAGRIIDQLEAAGIVGPFEGSKAREVKVKDEYILEQILRDLDK
ncbi:MAG: DNA translocase FtsK [Bacteroidetes bacterium]|nr:DNA translocase FtsK [Bacteroidota bacterium]